MRTSTACNDCRQAKRRCRRQKRSEPCSSCLERGLICQDRLQTRCIDRPVLIGRTTTTSENTAQASVAALPHGTTIELVDLYFDKFQGRPHSIFHPATLRSQVRNGTVSRALLYAVCAMSCKFSGNPDLRTQDLALAEEAKRLLQADISNACIENIQTCILVGTLSVGHGDSASEVIYFRVATAMAEILKLDSHFKISSDIECESRRRIWCSLFITDLWCLSGQGLRSQMDDKLAGIILPSNDQTPASRQSEHLTVSTRPSIWSPMVTLVPIFAPIHKINHRIANGVPQTADLDHEVFRLARSLEKWKQDLPAEAEMTPLNLQRQQRIGLGGILISLHLAYHHFSILLYFRFLEGPQISKIGATFATRCQVHASSFSSLILQSRQLKGCDVVYPNIGHMTTVSSAVLVHKLLFGDQSELGTARKELSDNFEALVELTRYWPATSIMIERLLAFQEMCLRSKEGDAHKLDGWMLKFLIDHSLDQGGKNVEGEDSSVGQRKIASQVRDLTKQGRYVSLHRS